MSRRSHAQTHSGFGLRTSDFQVFISMSSQTSTPTLQDCKSCGGGAPVDVHFCPQCTKILSLGRHGDYFSFLGLPRKLNIDPSELERRFRTLSRQFHPDFFYNAAPAERRASLERSSYLNDAYRALKQPVTRVEYLLQLEGLAARGPAGGVEAGAGGPARGSVRPERGARRGAGAPRERRAGRRVARAARSRARADRSQARRARGGPRVAVGALGRACSTATRRTPSAARSWPRCTIACSSATTSTTSWRASNGS